MTICLTTDLLVGSNSRIYWDTDTYGVGLSCWAPSEFKGIALFRGCPFFISEPVKRNPAEVVLGGVLSHVFNLTSHTNTPVSVLVLFAQRRQHNYSHI